MTTLPSPQESAWQRGNKLTRSLGNFYTLGLVTAVLFLLLSVGGLAFYLSVPSGLGASNGIVYVVVALIILLLLAGIAVNLRIVRSAKEAIATVTGYAGEGRPLQANKVESFVKWLTIWQWLAIVCGVLGAVGGLANGLFSGLLGGVGHDNSSLGLVVGGLSGLGSVIRNVIQVVLTWLALAAIKEFFVTVMRRAAGQAIAVTPAAQKASSWLVFTIVILILAALLGSLSFIGIFAAVLIPNLLGGAKTSVPISLSLLALIPIVLFAALQIWQIVLVSRSGGFAKDVASALDSQTAMGAQGALASDPWAGAVIEERP